MSADRSPLAALQSAERKETEMLESTVTAKGQTTVPSAVRIQAGAGPGTRLVWHVMPDGSVLVRVKSKSILDLVGSLKGPRGKRVGVDDMNAWR
jgi:antitoxin PrlF